MKVQERSKPINLSNEVDDVDELLASLSESERKSLAVASAAFDIAILLYKARDHKHLSQADAAQLAGLQQQAVSRMERPGVNPRLTSIHSYLSALGYSLEIRAIDNSSGKSIASARLP